MYKYGVRKIRIASTIISLYTLIGCASNTVPQGLAEFEIDESVNEQSFDWRVVNNFRPFSKWEGNKTYDRNRKNVISTDLLKIAVDESELIEYNQLALSSNSIGSDETLIIPENFSTLSRRHYDPIEDQFVFYTGLVGDVEYGAEVYTPTDRVLVKLFSRLAGDCIWNVMESSEISESVQGPCREAYFLANSEGLELEIDSVQFGKKFSILVKPEEEVLVALGDSYLSGEGMGAFVDQKCSMSLYSWPYLVTAALASANSKKVYTIVNRACSGADIVHITKEDYRGVAAPSLSYIDASQSGAILQAKSGSNYRKPQLESALRDICGAESSISNCDVKPKYVFLGIGGNDAGFGPVIFDAIKGSLDASDIKNDYSDRIAKVSEDYIALSEEIIKTFPDSRILSTNNINPLRKYDGSLCDGTENRSLFNNLFAKIFKTIGFRITQSEIAILERDLVDKVLGNEGIAGVSAQLESQNPGKWTFVKTYNSLVDESAEYSVKYATRGLCEGDKVKSSQDSWFNDLTEADSKTKRFNGVVHPNIYGQLYYTKKILESICEIDGNCN